MLLRKSIKQAKVHGDETGVFFTPTFYFTFAFVWLVPHKDYTTIDMYSVQARSLAIIYLGIASAMALAILIASLVNDRGIASFYIFPACAFLAIVHHIVTWRLVVKTNTRSGRRTLVPSIVVLYIFVLAWVVGTIIAVVALVVGIRVYTELGEAASTPSSFSLSTIGGYTYITSDSSDPQGLARRFIVGLSIQLFYVLGSMIVDIMIMVELHRERRKDREVTSGA